MSKIGNMDFSKGLIIAPIILTVYGQLIVKWRVRQAGSLPVEFAGKMQFLMRLLLDPWIISVLLAAALAALTWFAAMTKYELSYAYPFMSIAFILVLVLSAVFFNEAITIPKVLGVVLITAGVIISSQG
jgi:uncharacterized membrane protein